MRYGTRPTCPACPEPLSLKGQGTMAQTDTESRLAPRQLSALEALMNREPDETLEDCGKRAGVSRRTMHRYLRDSDFNAELRARVTIEFAGQRGRMAQALVKGGTVSGPGQASMQKIFWTMLGELKDSKEGSLQDQNQYQEEFRTLREEIDKLSPEVKRLLAADLEGQIGEKQRAEMKEILKGVKAEEE